MAGKEKYNIAKRDDMRADYTIDQDYKAYTEEDHQIWRDLYHRQLEILPGRACNEFMEGLERIGMFAEGIPDFRELNKILMAETGWQVVAVPGAVPGSVFFDHLANKRFPVTEWIRSRAQMDYLEEPDVFHDIFGHVPLLINPIFANYIEAYGKGGVRSLEYKAGNKLGRLYWYTVEFGLMNTAEGLRIYGAGVLSSPEESVYALESDIPRRYAFDMERMMQTDFDIHNLQTLYFVIDSFEQLFEATQQDFAPIYERLAGKPVLSPADGAETDLLL